MLQVNVNIQFSSVFFFFSLLFMSSLFLNQRDTEFVTSVCIVRKVQVTRNVGKSKSILIMLCTCIKFPVKMVGIVFCFLYISVLFHWKLWQIWMQWIFSFPLSDQILYIPYKKTLEQHAMEETTHMQIILTFDLKLLQYLD